MALTSPDSKRNLILYTWPHCPFRRTCIWAKILIAANTLTLVAVINRATHRCRFWFILLTFRMQRSAVWFSQTVIHQRRRSGLGENKPASDLQLRWAHRFMAHLLLLFCWSLKVQIAVPHRETPITSFLGNEICRHISMKPPLNPRKPVWQRRYRKNLHCLDIHITMI